MRIVAIIQARMGSTRLPKKVLMPIAGQPALRHIINRIRCVKSIDQIVIATSTDIGDDEIEAFCVENKISVYRGSQHHVLERFYEAATKEAADVVVRLTGDNVLIDPMIIEAGVNAFLADVSIDYMYYCEGLPLGVAVEIFKYSALKRAYEEAEHRDCIEHVTPYLYRNPDMFKAVRIGKIYGEYGHLRWTLDTEADYKLVNAIYDVFEKGAIFGMNEVLEQYAGHPEWGAINTDVEQNKVVYAGEKMDGLQERSYKK